MTGTDDLPPLTALRAFHAAGRLGSFQAAARALAVTPSAISHQVRSLEAWLGQPLFTRGARRIDLTKAGRALLGDIPIADAVPASIADYRPMAGLGLGKYWMD